MCIANGCKWTADLSGYIAVITLELDLLFFLPLLITSYSSRDSFTFSCCFFRAKKIKGEREREKKYKSREKTVKTQNENQRTTLFLEKKKEMTLFEKK